MKIFRVCFPYNEDHLDGSHISLIFLAEELMRQAELVTRMRRLWERTRQGKSFEHIEDDKLKRKFNAVAPNLRWM